MRVYPIESATGAMEFHKILELIKQSQIYSMAQFEQLCKDCQNEMLTTPLCKVGIARIFDKYYDLDWGYLELRRLSVFIRSGRYKSALEMYGA